MSPPNPPPSSRIWVINEGSFGQPRSTKSHCDPLLASLLLLVSKLGFLLHLLHRDRTVDSVMGDVPVAGAPDVGVLAVADIPAIADVPSVPDVLLLLVSVLLTFLLLLASRP
jgi:hypothetical protein